MKTKTHKLDELAAYLTERSAEICADNQCTDDEHNCESFAYISHKCGEYCLHDICYPDFWHGWGSHDEALYGELAALPMPFDGDGVFLERAIMLELI